MLFNIGQLKKKLFTDQTIEEQKKWINFWALLQIKLLIN